MDGWSPRYHQLQEEDKYVMRMKKHLPDKFRDMCNMHLAFILNLSDDKLENILNGDNSNSKKNKLDILAPIFKKKVKTGSCLFGSPLSAQSVCLMTPLIKILSLKENISKEGLFRKPGNRQRMRNLREALIANGPSVQLDTSVYNAYDIAGVLKEFLRDLPEPLLSDRHMEAHRQINDLGKHARSAEDQTRYAAKKLSALQLLMQLLPTPYCRMTNLVINLLHAVSKTSETKMTPNTLATIFAPIFFLDRKVSALDVCEAVKEAEPALTFMIENAEKMFKVPKELSVDVVNYWKELETTPYDIKPETSGKLSHSYKIRKSTSGRTLNTAVCYLDREQSKTVDVASHTQAELDNLYAHVQSLPDTPGNQRIKDLMARRSRTPLSSGRKHTRSKSIGASIRKMVPSLSKSKAKSLDMSVQSHITTPYTNNKSCSLINSSVMSELMKSPATTLSATTCTIAQSISLHTKPSPSILYHNTPVTRKRGNTEKQSSLQQHECTPPKQECRNSNVASNFTVISTPTSSSKANTTCPISTPASSSKGNVCQDAHNSTSDSFLLCGATQYHSPMKLKKKSVQSTSLPTLSSVATPKEAKDILRSPQVAAGDTENEISYIPIIQRKEKSFLDTKSVTSPLDSPISRRPLRQCNVPGTPIMPRAVLQIPRYTFETSL